ncbi:hypothetical protein AB0H36_32735 [Kribbella sp. NPDC050820]|uniref:hypothetical protein n=1 Tax=Kribbella sp. NPDC050820 TaxID=3155408 RepID=UPI0033CADADA
MGSKQAGSRLIPVRSAVIMTLALLVAVGAGVLTYLQEPALPTAVLVGAGAWAGAVTFFNALIDRD